jgi:predicted flap endonuclease-1-like 5' DNA nuclease
MSVSLKSFASLDDTAVRILWSKGLRTNEDLLAMTATDTDRKKLASELDTDESTIMELARRADLARIKGIGNLYAQLLGRAHVDRTQDLAKKEIDELYKTLGELNRAYRIARRIPKKENVSEWIEAARQLPPVLEQ